MTFHLFHRHELNDGCPCPCISVRKHKAYYATKVCNPDAPEPLFEPTQGFLLESQSNNSIEKE